MKAFDFPQQRQHIAGLLADADGMELIESQGRTERHGVTKTLYKNTVYRIWGA